MSPTSIIYMIYASTDNQLKQLLTVTEVFSIYTKRNLVLTNVKLDVYTEKNVSSTGTNYSMVVPSNPSTREIH
jgi:hypothetical protein